MVFTKLLSGCVGLNVGSASLAVWMFLDWQFNGESSLFMRSLASIITCAPTSYRNAVTSCCRKILGTMQLHRDRQVHREGIITAQSSLIREEMRSTGGTSSSFCVVCSVEDRGVGVATGSRKVTIKTASNEHTARSWKIVDTVEA